MINVFDKNLTADASYEFYYKIGRVQTNKIWKRPSFESTQNLLQDIKNTSDIFTRYKVYIMGGITWDFSTTWDIDLVICSDSYDTVTLENDIDFINNKALNEHRLLVDVEWKNKPLENLNYQELLHNDFTTHTYNGIKLGYVHKKMNGYEQIIDNTKKTHSISGRELLKLGDYLILIKQGPRKIPEKVINKIKNTRGQEARFDFLAEEFINYDESYFNNIKNINI